MNTTCEKKEKPKKENKTRNIPGKSAKGGKGDKKKDGEEIIENKGGAENNTHPESGALIDGEERTTYFMAKEAVTGFLQRCPLVSEVLASHLSTQFLDAASQALAKSPVTALSLVGNSTYLHFFVVNHIY